MKEPAPRVELSFAEFTSAAAVLVAVCREFGTTTPTFRTPPRLPRRDRTIRRRRDGSVTVAVRLVDRPWMAVVADMVEGCLVASRGAAERNDDVEGRLRRALWDGLAKGWEAPSTDERSPGRARPQPRVATGAARQPVVGESPAGLRAA